jgi:hypothetical protein
VDLYVAGAGFYPARTLPCVIDVGTNNERLLGSHGYLGLQRKRMKGKRCALQLHLHELIYELIHELIYELITELIQLLVLFVTRSSFTHTPGCIEKVKQF